MTTHPQKITFGELRASGVRDVLIYCQDQRCSHSNTISADRWPDHVRLSLLASPERRDRDLGRAGRHRGRGDADGLIAARQQRTPKATTEILADRDRIAECSASRCTGRTLMRLSHEQPPECKSGGANDGGDGG
jgi:hypothetical protein